MVFAAQMLREAKERGAEGDGRHHHHRVLISQLPGNEQRQADHRDNAQHYNLRGRPDAVSPNPAGSRP